MHTFVFLTFYNKHISTEISFIDYTQKNKKGYNILEKIRKICKRLCISLGRVNTILKHLQSARM